MTLQFIAHRVALFHAVSLFVASLPLCQPVNYTLAYHTFCTVHNIQNHVRRQEHIRLLPTPPTQYMQFSQSWTDKDGGQWYNIWIYPSFEITNRMKQYHTAPCPLLNFAETTNRGIHVQNHQERGQKFPIQLM